MMLQKNDEDTMSRHGDEAGDYARVEERVNAPYSTQRQDRVTGGI